MVASQIDLTSLDSISAFPSVREAVYSEYVLGPGEMLFIPRWHWHLVISLDEATALDWRRQHLKEDKDGSNSMNENNNSSPRFSVSVSLWWGASLEKQE